MQAPRLRGRVERRGDQSRQRARSSVHVPPAERESYPTPTSPSHQPVFHEGSKGYLCCKRRVLEFTEFLKIPGCKTGRHLFVGQKKDGEELVQCRVDHYQTPMQVHVSAYAKGWGMRE